MNGFLFLLYAPIIGPVLGLIVGIIASIINSEKSNSSPKSGRKSVGGSRSYSYHNYDNPSSHYDYNIPDYSYYSLESEMRAHNARMEQLMREQNKIMIDNESRRISESMNRSLAEQFDTRITNIFRNPWEGIL